jgi:hypothetical protein
MTRLTGRDAIDYAREHNLTLCKYNDPIEWERDDLSIEEAEVVAREDAGLIYLDLIEGLHLDDDEFRKAIKNHPTARS